MGSFSPRMMEVLWHIGGLSHEDLRVLAVCVRELIADEDRRRAQELQTHVGERCDVLLPDELHMEHALLAAVNVEMLTATVQQFPDLRRQVVPVHSIYLRHPEQPIGNRPDPPLKLGEPCQTTAPPEARNAGGSAA